MSIKKRQSILLGTVIMCATFVLISISWAAFSSTLTVGGTGNVSAQSWDIDFTNTVGTKWTIAQKLSGTSVSLAELPASTDTSAFSLPKDGEASGFLGTLKMSGDKITYTWYVQNFGTLDATYSINGVIATNTYTNGSNVDITCNTSDNSTDKTFCNNYVKTTVTVDGDVTTPTSSYSLGKAGSSTDHATVMLTIEITGTDQIYSGTLANYYENNTRATLLSNVQKLGSSNGDLNISIKGLKLIEKQDVVSTSEETTTTSPYNQYINKTYSFSYTGKSDTFTVEYPGKYKIELWGASGGNYNDTYHAGYGGYTSGIITLSVDDTLQINVGGQGMKGSEINSSNQAFSGGFNGGGNGSYYSGGHTSSGGGATDVRIGSFSIFERIMVAAGGGGAGDYRNSNVIAGGSGGAGGGLTGYDGINLFDSDKDNYVGRGATQVSGGLGKDSDHYGIFYQGANSPVPSDDRSGGGGGWYGGGASYENRGAGGGSSYISGHTGCISINALSDTSAKKDESGSTCTLGTTDNFCSIHYSGYKFTNTVIIDGDGYNWTTSKGSLVGIPSYDGSSTLSNYVGNGYAKITYLGE